MILPSLDKLLKKHLFYLVDYDLISYGGQKQMDIIKESFEQLYSVIQGRNNIKRTLTKFLYNCIPNM